MNINTPIDEEKLRSEIHKILKEYLVEGHFKRYKCDYTFLKPSENLYKFQFFWDSCFHIFILCVLGELDIAKSCFRSLFALQKEDGFVGHIHYWKNVLPSNYRYFSISPRQRNKLVANSYECPRSTTGGTGAASNLEIFGR